MMNIQRIKVNLQCDMQIFHPGLAFHWMPLDRKLATSDQGLHCLQTGISIKNKINTRHPINKKWTCPINKDGIIHQVNGVN